MLEKPAPAPTSTSATATARAAATCTIPATTSTTQPCRWAPASTPASWRKSCRGLPRLSCEGAAGRPTSTRFGGRSSLRPNRPPGRTTSSDTSSRRRRDRGTRWGTAPTTPSRLKPSSMPAEEGAGHRADAADDGGDQRLQPERDAADIAEGAVVDGRHIARQTGQQGGQRKRHEQHSAAVDAEQLRRQGIVGAGSPGAAEPTGLHEPRAPPAPRRGTARPPSWRPASQSPGSRRSAPPPTAC